MILGYKIRIFPNKRQAALLDKHFDACRFVWNYMLGLEEQRHNDGLDFLSAFDMNNHLTKLKRMQEYEWLNVVSVKSLQAECRSLFTAYQLFFKHKKGHPNFKTKKRPSKSFVIRHDRPIFYSNYISIEKVGRVRFKTDYDILDITKNKLMNVRVIKECGKYMVGFCVERENQTHDLNQYAMGIDLGLKELAVVACGDDQMVFHNINHSKRIKETEARLKHKQRIVSRKIASSYKQFGEYRKTKNIIRASYDVQRLYRRLHNIRINYIHQTTHKLVSMLPHKVVMESLSIMMMLKNKHLSKAALDQCLYEFIRQMKYKCEYYGIEFVQVPRHFPSSKMCSCCGNVKAVLRLSERLYSCDHCGTVIDRDYNAAVNLMRYKA